MHAFAMREVHTSSFLHPLIWNLIHPPFSLYSLFIIKLKLVQYFIHKPNSDTIIGKAQKNYF